MFSGFFAVFRQAGDAGGGYAQDETLALMSDPDFLAAVEVARQLSPVGIEVSAHHPRHDRDPTYFFNSLLT